MYLGQVRVRNFRNLHDLTVGFDDGLNVLVGENNIGKTNLLDAIRAALGVGAGHDVLRLSPEDRFVDSAGKLGDGPIRIDLQFAGLSEEHRGEFVELLSFDAGDPAASTVSIHFEWSYDDSAKRWSSRRWGGARSASEGGIPEDLLQALPVTRLDALRDAVAALAPGRSSRLARALAALAGTKDESDLIATFLTANTELEKHPLVQRFQMRISALLRDASGPVLGQQAAVRASEPEFDRILNSLRVLVGHAGGGTFELRRNGLGYNNLLYIATVLTELEARRNEALPLLLVEEPEAHLHPHLQTLLVEFLRAGLKSPPDRSPVQTIVTTHSPTIASHVSPRLIRALHLDEEGRTRCCAIGKLGLNDAEERKLRRMLDVTRATMLFARGVLLVEGVSEALLLPVLARRLGHDLARAGVSVVPIAGVDFATLVKLYGADKLVTKVAIVTDADPGAETIDDRKVPKKDASGAIAECARLTKLRADISTEIGLFHSKVTLEYDLSEAASGNAIVVHDAWSSLYERSPGLKRAAIEEATEATERARLLWEAVCLGEPTHGKADLAQALANLLDERDRDSDAFRVAFEVPRYLRQAIEYVLPEQPAADTP
jgi:putative ATP-dependent endonuclease of OLD family